MPDGNPTTTWTESELDDALTRLNADVHTDDAKLARARDTLLREAMTSAAPGAAAAGSEDGVRARDAQGGAAQRRRRPHYWLAAAAAVLVLLAGAVLIRTELLGPGAPVGAPPPTSTQAPGVNAIGATDQPIPQGQYRYFAASQWQMSGKGRLVLLVEQLTEVWMPADRDQEWLRRETATGRVRMLVGTEQEAVAEGLLPRPTTPPRETRAPRGEFDGPNVPAGWATPTPEFLAALPTDPAQLLQRLRADIAARGANPDVEQLAEVIYALRTGRVPAPVRSNLYRALALSPSVKVGTATTLDGRSGVSLTTETGSEKLELIVDPLGGQPIGERTTALRFNGLVPGGTVTSDSSFDTRIAPKLGEKPA